MREGRREREREMKGIERGLPRMQQSFSMSMNITVVATCMHRATQVMDSGGPEFCVESLKCACTFHTTPIAFI